MPCKAILKVRGFADELEGIMVYKTTCTFGYMLTVNSLLPLLAFHWQRKWSAIRVYGLRMKLIVHIENFNLGSADILY